MKLTWRFFRDVAIATLLGFLGMLGIMQLYDWMGKP